MERSRFRSASPRQHCLRPQHQLHFFSVSLTVRNSLFLRRKIDAVFGFRLRTQNFDLIWRHDLDLWLPVAKLDCTGDADDFPLDHSESLIGCYSGHGRNEASERLIGVFSSEIDKCCTQRAARHRYDPTSHLDRFADILNRFRVFYDYWLIRTRRNRAKEQTEHCNKRTDAHALGYTRNSDPLTYDRFRIQLITSAPFFRVSCDSDKFVFLRLRQKAISFLMKNELRNSNEA